uniref:Uncharacterized protein n=1 Tax=Cannabis sativa TaxID=3483 RepID=A0A803QZV2_CANSA
MLSMVGIRTELRAIFIYFDFIKMFGPALFKKTSNPYKLSEPLYFGLVLIVFLSNCAVLFCI